MSSIHTASGRRIYYDDIGSGPPILLIPGLSGYRRGCIVWLATGLAPHLRVLSIDNRDSGESSPEPGYYTLADLANDAIALLDALGIARAHVLGHSFGGKVALQIAVDHPERVDRLILVSSSATIDPGHHAGGPVPPPEDWWVNDPVERMRRLVPEIVGSDFLARMGDEELTAIAVLEEGNRATWAGVMRQEASYGAGEVAARLDEVRSPTLVLVGDEDGLRGERVKSLVETIPAARSVVLPGVGHLPWVERPAEAHRAILDFLAEPIKPSRGS